MTEKSPHSDHVRTLLEELHEALGESETLDPALETPLRTTLQEVREALERAQAEREPEATGLTERVEALALEFEAAHPTLAGLINRLTVQLASLGF